MSRRRERQIDCRLQLVAWIGTLFDLDAVFEHQRVWGDDEPVIVIVHLACPVLTFTDRGKSNLALPYQIEEAVESIIIKITAAWTKQRKAEDRDSAARAKRQERLARRQQVKIKDAAYAVMEEAYLTASAQGTLPAAARQIMYAARPAIQEQTGKQLDDAYFTQGLLPDYMADHPDRCADWNVTFDDRGHLIEPHTEREIGLGTLSVDSYIDDCKNPMVEAIALKEVEILTCGPMGRFGGLLFTEKEGFMPLFAHVHLAERFDLALMSSKGTQTTSARRLAEAICSKHNIPLFVLHDCDKTGFTIASLFKRSNRRYRFTKRFKVIDIGLRLTDVHDERLLGSAEAVFDKGSREARSANLRENGATDAEIEFLLNRRVELNALPSDRLVHFVERKLIAHGVRKFVPGTRLLQQTYRTFAHEERARPLVEKALAEAAKGPAFAVPANLQDRVAAFLKKNPRCPWDVAVAKIVRGDKS